jgi:LPS O-antigen subunit length determinant protein (WzzB/FepE family)
MKRLVCALVIALAAATGSAVAEPAKDVTADTERPGTEAAPGYEDFENRELSPQEVEEMQERRDDRNVVSPGRRDEQELDREMGRD